MRATLNNRHTEEVAMASAKKNPEQVPDEKQMTLPWWGKILIGTLITALIVKFTPILEILTLSFYIVMVPMFLFVGLGLISAGTAEAMTDGWKKTVAEINERVNDKLKAAA